ncbi:MAG TPA: V-type ATP synthase subunit E [Sedimentibacter sp.]|nr:V-type ATP synthase subunit E [Sedimentibacter sp.]
MSIENITANILSDAKNTAENSLAKAELTGQDIINNAKKEAEVIIKAQAELSLKDAEGLKSRKASAAELQGRKMLLFKKQEAINESFNVALGMLKSMDSDDYINFLANQIVTIPNCEGNLILNESDGASIGEKLVNSVNEKLKGKKVILSNERHKSSGGFILKRGNIEINSTFETILNSMKDELTGEIASTLFK